MAEEKKNWKNILSWTLLILVSAMIGLAGPYLMQEYMPEVSFWGVIATFFVFMLSIPLHVVLHEIGHLIGGLLSGYQFIMFRLFNTVWIKTEAGLSKRKQFLQGLLGQALMVPPEEKAEPPFLLYHSGGLIMNLLTALVMIWIGLAISNQTISFMLFASALAALLLFISNLIPMKPNDGYNILQHYKRPETLHDFTNILYLYSGLVKGESFTDLLRYINLEGSESIEDPNNVTLYTVQAGAYFEQNKFDQAREIYEKLWLQREHLLPAHQPEVYFNYLFSLLVAQPHHEDVAKIQETTVYKNLQSLKLADRLKVSAAEAMYLHEDYTKAMDLLAEGEPMIARAPTISEEKLERHLYAYLKNEIQRLQQTV